MSSSEKTSPAIHVTPLDLYKHLELLISNDEYILCDPYQTALNISMLFNCVVCNFVEFRKYSINTTWGEMMSQESVYLMRKKNNILIE